MDNAIAIRPARPTDAGNLVKLVEAFPTPTPPGHESFSTAFSIKLSDPASYIGVADCNGLLVGYLSAYCHVTFYAGGKIAWVDEVLVDAEYRGRKIGSMLMGAFEEWARGQGCILVSLATAGARGFYERLGYTSKAGYYKKYF